MTREKCFAFLCAALACVSLSGCPNVFSETANKDTDAALMYRARQMADRRDWTGAINLISLMSAEARAQRETRYTLASMYAGRCGMELLSFASSLVDGIGAGQKVLPIVLSVMRNATAARRADCLQAEAELLAIDTAASSRVPDENILLAFVEFAKMGSVLATSGADTDNDGALDGGFDPCTDNSTHIVDSDIQKLATGLTIGFSSLLAAGSTAAGEAAGELNTMCGAVDTFLGNPPDTFCSQTEESDFTGIDILAIRALIKSNELGFNTCNGSIGQNQAGTANDCICPVIP